MKYHYRKILMIMFAVSYPFISFSCANRYFVAVIQSTNTTAIAKNKVKVKIELSPRSLINNKITVVNRSSETLAVGPDDIVLKIEKTGVSLPSVPDYRRYVEMRYKEAKQKCDKTKYPYSCSDGIERYFKKYLKADAFQFGEIPPGKKRTGFFAFNLPDPFNPTVQSKHAAELLKEKSPLLGGQISVAFSTVSKTPGSTRFVFPVNVITSSDESNTFLRVMRNF